jgi:phosphate transport system substrate-binding protein
MTKFLRRSFVLVFVAKSLLLSACASLATREPVTVVQTQVGEKLITSTPDLAEPTSLPIGAIKINGAGATFPLPVFAAWTYAYSYVDPTVVITYQGIGSGGGKQAIIDGTIDFAGSDSLLQAEEYKAGNDLQMYPILAGAVVVIYNFTPAKDYPADVEVPALVLDRQTLVDIYNGIVIQWNDPKITALNPQLADYLPAATITAVHRSDSSGTTELFTRSLAAFSADWTAGGATAVEWPIDKVGNGVGGEGNQGVAAVVINTANSLGYVELSYALSNSLAYADMINKAGKKVTASKESLAAAINDFGTAALNDQLTATIVDGGGDGSWPMSGFTYLILHTTRMTDCVKARKLIEYIHWTLTDAAAADRAASLGYVVLPVAVRDQVLAKLGDVTCDGQPVMK